MNFWDVAKNYMYTPLPQKRVTSKKLEFLQPVPVISLVGPLPLPLVYTKKGDLAKRQPDPLNKGDLAFVKLRADGLVSIYPFALAGSGYELVDDAEENVHYTFV